MVIQADILHKYLKALAGIFVLFGLYLTSFYSYLLFHSLSEIFSIVIAFGIFLVAWNSRRFHENNYLKFLGIAYPNNAIAHHGILEDGVDFIEKPFSPEKIVLKVRQVLDTD